MVHSVSHSVSALALCGGLALTSVFAGAGAAQDFDPIRAEVLPGWQMKDGRRMAALHLTLEPGWKTYWRAPGDAGIPPSFDWSSARNVQGIDVTWPTPSVHDQNGYRTIGYSDSVTIPVVISPKKTGKAVRLRGRMDIGVCSDVCLPHSIEFDAVLEGDATRPTPRIAAALADTPYSSDEAGVTSSVCSISPTEDGMEITAKVTLPHTGGQEVAVIEPGFGNVWVSETKTQRSGAIVTATSEMIHENGGAFAVDRSAIRITILGQDYAVDVQGCTAS